MSVDFVREEIYYYKGFKPTDEEVNEIFDYYRQNSHADLSEVISDYYGY